MIPKFQKVIKTCFSSDDLLYNENKRKKSNHSLQSPPINLATTAKMKVEQISFLFVTKLKGVLIGPFIREKLRRVLFSPV